MYKAILPAILEWEEERKNFKIWVTQEKISGWGGEKVEIPGWEDWKGRNSRSRGWKRRNSSSRGWIRRKSINLRNAYVDCRTSKAQKYLSDVLNIVTYSRFNFFLDGGGKEKIQDKAGKKKNSRIRVCKRRILEWVGMGYLWRNIHISSTFSLSGWRKSWKVYTNYTIHCTLYTNYTIHCTF